MFSSGCLGIPDGISLPFIYLFILNFDKVFSMILTRIYCCWMPFTVGYFPFYSAILGFPGYHWFVHLLPWVPETLVGWSFPYFSLFSSFGVSFLKASCWLSALRCPKELTFGLSSFKASRSHFFRLNFWLSFPLSFFPSELIPSCHVESFPSTFLHGSSFWVPRGTGSLFMNCWFLSLLIHFLHHWVADRDISTLISCVSWSHPPPLLNCLNPTLALLHVPGIPSSWKSPSIPVQFLSLGSPAIF